MSQLADKISTLLEGNFSIIRIDDTHEAVNAETGPADSLMDEDSIRDSETPLEDETRIVRLQTEDDDVFFFREEDILEGKVEEGTTLIALDTDGTERRLQFLQESPVLLKPASMAKVICNNDAIIRVLTQLPSESDKQFEARTKDTLEALAKKDFEKNKHSYKPEPALDRDAYAVYRNQLYWHVHTVPIN